MAPKTGMERLHGVEPKGKPHFDFQWFSNKEVGLRQALKDDAIKNPC